MQRFFSSCPSRELIGEDTRCVRVKLSLSIHQIWLRRAVDATKNLINGELAEHACGMDSCSYMFAVDLRLQLAKWYKNGTLRLVNASYNQLGR